MASEGSFFSKSNLAFLPAGLLVLALLFAVLSFAVGWFAVTTRIQVWRYDAAAPDGKGEYTGASVRVHTEFEQLQLNSRMEPKELERRLDELSDRPSYEREMDRTGTKMLGIFLLDLVTFVGLAGTGGFYYWNRRSRRDFSRTIWRYATVFFIFGAFSLVYLFTQVPAAARTDTSEILHAYAGYIQSNPQTAIPVADEMLSPNIKFWNTWICCPPDSHFDNPSGPGMLLVVVTTTSRPSAGFWLTAGEMGLAGAALVLASRAGELDPKGSEKPNRPELYPTYKAA